MMPIQLKIWKRLITKQAPFPSHHVSKAMSLFPSLAIYAKPHLKFPNFCTERMAPSTIPPDRGVVAEFFLNKCSLTKEDITKVFKHNTRLLRWKSAQNCDEVLELLSGCGLTTPAQIRKVIFSSPTFFFRRCERNIKTKLSVFRTFMKEEDIVKLLCKNAQFIMCREDRLKSKVSLLRKLGLDGEVVSELLTKQPRFLMATDKNVIESFQNAEDLGFIKGSKMFTNALVVILFRGKEKINRKRLCFSGLGFSEKQVSDILRRHPMVLPLSEEKVKRNVDFLVNSVGLPLDDIVTYPALIGLSLEKRMIPRYRVMEALESMQLPKLKISFPSVCNLSERIFLEKYIHSNAESSSVLLDIYHGGKVDH